MQPDRQQSRAPIAEATPTYDWQRFWVSRTGTLDLLDGGFLPDPTSPFLRSHPLMPSTLSELAKYRALALLGEPGIGKSTVLATDAARIASLPVTEDTISIRLDLRAYSSEVLLYRKLFESAEFLAWVNGNSHLVLYSSTVWTGRHLLRIDSVANLLAGVSHASYPNARMSLRIACRTAVWPSATLEPLLNELWGEDADRRI